MMSAKEDVRNKSIRILHTERCIINKSISVCIQIRRDLNRIDDVQQKCSISDADGWPSAFFFAHRTHHIWFNIDIYQETLLNELQFKILVLLFQYQYEHINHYLWLNSQVFNLSIRLIQNTFTVLISKNPLTKWQIIDDEQHTDSHSFWLHSVLWLDINFAFELYIWKICIFYFALTHVRIKTLSTLNNAQSLIVRNWFNQARPRPPLIALWIWSQSDLPERNYFSMSKLIANYQLHLQLTGSLDTKSLVKVPN